MATTVRVDEGTWAMLREVAHQSHRTMSELAATIIRDGLNAGVKSLDIPPFEEIAPARLEGAKE